MRKLVCAVMVRFPLGGHEGEENDDNDEDDSSSANDNIIVDGDDDVEDTVAGMEDKEETEFGNDNIVEEYPVGVPGSSSSSSSRRRTGVLGRQQHETETGIARQKQQQQSQPQQQHHHHGLSTKMKKSLAVQAASHYFVQVVDWDLTDPNTYTHARGVCHMYWIQIWAHLSGKKWTWRQ
jgi:hypothetical protein